MRSHYWTCSKFADWLRGTPKPKAETSEGWDIWTRAARTAHPFRYWLADDGLDFLQKVVFFIPDKLYDVKYYINNRYVTRTHSLTAHARDIRPGDWCDVGNRFLPCLFNELVDFVEIELAWSNIAWNEEARDVFKAPWWSVGWFRWRTWRSAEAGLANLEWQRNLIYDEEYAGMNIPADKIKKLTPQAVKAQEILDLYTWWTVTRPKRVEPMDESGWSALCEARRIKAEAEGRDSLFASMNDRTPAEKKESKKALDKLHKLEAQYEKEDEDMMIRLIKVRHGLWT